MKILIGYASPHGSTRQIAEFMARLLRAYDIEVDVVALANVDDVAPYDAVIVGSAIHASMWLQEVSLFFDRCGEAAKGKTHLFITCIRVLEQGGREHCLEEYVHHATLEAEAIPLEGVGVFPGKLDVTGLNWDERWLLASNYDGTEASKHAYHDYRDWHLVSQWTHNVAQQLALKPTF